MTPRTLAWTRVGALLVIMASASQALAAVDAEASSDAAPAVLPAAAFEFVATGRLAHGRIGHSATLLRDGRVLVVGGYGTPTAEIWDPQTGEWTDPSCMGICRSELLADAAIWDPVTGETTELPPMTVARTEHTGTLLLDGRVLLVGSHTHGPDDETAELSQPRS
jgi:hypothetical protein